MWMFAFIVSPADALTDNSTSTTVLNVNLLAFILRLPCVVLMAGISQSSLSCSHHAMLRSPFCDSQFPHLSAFGSQRCHKFHHRESDCIEPLSGNRRRLKRA